MMRGMMASMRPTYPRNAQSAKRKIKIYSQDINTLLVDFLSEVLYLSQVKREAYEDIEFSQFTDQELECEAIGKKTGSFGEDIKAATHHGVGIQKNKDGLYQVDVIYDV